MTNRVMIDIETLGRDPGAAILSLAAVEFAPAEGLGRELSRSIDLSSCQQHGLDIDAATLDWWLDQSSEAQSALRGGDDLTHVLAGLSRWWPRDGAEVWSKSPAFDVVLLAEAYSRIDRDPPWQFWETRDVRTILSLVDTPPQVESAGPDHDALADAKEQALQINAVLDALEVGA
jgi:hypothetical protein